LFISALLLKNRIVHLEDGTVLYGTKTYVLLLQ
jgi:hypothetical protein